MRLSDVQTGSDPEEVGIVCCRLIQIGQSLGHHEQWQYMPIDRFQPGRLISTDSSARWDERTRSSTPRGCTPAHRLFDIGRDRPHAQTAQGRRKPEGAQSFR